MQEKRWGTFLCNCRSTLKLDLEKIGDINSFVELVSEPENGIHDFAEIVEKEGLENIIVGCCNERSLFKNALKNKDIHFLDLKGKCFLPHDDIDEANEKANRLINAEIAASKIKSKINVPINQLKVGNSILIYTEFKEGFKLASLLEQKLDVTKQGGVTICISPKLENLEENSPLLGQRSILEGIEGRLGNFLVKLKETSYEKTDFQKSFTLKSEQVVILAKNLPLGIKNRTGIHFFSFLNDQELEKIVIRIQELIGNFHKPEHVSYETSICAGGDKGIETCGRCITFCPYDAISRQKENLHRIKVDHFTCEGCGACVSACPTSALEFTEPSPKEIYSRIANLVSSSKKNNEIKNKPVIVFHCEEMGKFVLEKAGEIQLKYSPSILPVEVPCLRYVSESILLYAISMGAKGVGMLGCENCPNGERELLHQKLEFSQIILEKFGLGKDRLKIITSENGFEKDALGILDDFSKNIGESSLIQNLKTPRQTGNRSILGEILFDLIEQTGKEPGLTKVSKDQPFSVAEVNESGCTLCRSCANVCPTNAFRYNENENNLDFKHINCIGCGLCEQVCPENVIKLKSEIMLNKIGFEYATVAKDDMISCAKCNKPYINRRALESIEAKLFNIDSLKNTFSGNRKNILRMCPDCRTVEAVKEVEKGWEP